MSGEVRDATRQLIDRIDEFLESDRQVENLKVQCEKKHADLLWVSQGRDRLSLEKDQLEKMVVELKAKLELSQSDVLSFSDKCEVLCAKLSNSEAAYSSLQQQLSDSLEEVEAESKKNLAIVERVQFLEREIAVVIDQRDTAISDSNSRFDILLTQFHNVQSSLEQSKETENCAVQSVVRQLEQVQEELEYYFDLSKNQFKLLDYSTVLQKRAASLLANAHHSDID